MGGKKTIQQWLRAERQRAEGQVAQWPTTNVYSTRSATKGRNYCLLGKLYFVPSARVAATIGCPT